jgi:hypothetical protein
MTRAALLALRAANGLSVQCHYVITDGPTIGVAGNTSPTTILMHAVNSNELSTNVHVGTTFGGTADTWPGGYDIDFGPQGSIFVLTDDWNNRVSDSDVNAPTVHTQFPWHARGALLRDNIVDDCTLTNWAAAVAAGVLITDNNLLNAGIHLTGMTNGSFIRNHIQGPQVTVSSPNVLFNSNEIRNAAVTFAGTNAGAQSFQSNALLGGLFEVTAATTGLVDANRNVIGGQGIIGYRVRIDGSTGPTSVSGNRLFNQGPNTTADLRVAGGTVTFDSNEVGAGEVNINAAAAVSVTASSLTQPTLAITAGTTVQALRVSGSTVTVATPAGSTLRNVDVIESTFNLTGPGTVAAGRVVGGTVTNAGFGLSTFDIVGGTKTLTANNTYVASNPGFDNVT